MAPANMVPPNAIYQTPEDFRKAYKAYLENPKLITVYTKDGPIDAAVMNYDGVAVELGFSSRQGIYDQAKRKGEGWKEVVQEFKSDIKAFWYAYGSVGNSGFANFVLSVMGEVPTTKVDHTSSDGSLRPSVIQLVGPDDNSSDSDPT